MPPRTQSSAISSGRAAGRGRGRPRGGARETPNPFLPLLEQVRRDLDARLEDVFGRKLDDAQSLGADVIALVEALHDLTMRGGKRFRPALLFAAFRAVDDRASDAIPLEAGVALELLQTYLLVHDDWMDRDDVRRGGPAVHAMLARHYGSRATGDAAAVLAGDYAAALALEALAAIDAPADRLGRSVALFAQIQQDAIRGQQIDLGGRSEDIERMHDLKTGSYTVRGPILLGATLAGANERTLRELSRFALPLGVAFQLRDDLIGAFGDPVDTGKPFGSDIRSGKRTSLAAEALARVGPAERHFLADTIGQRDATDVQIRKVIGAYERSGAREAVERRLAELVKKALAALHRTALPKKGIGWLVGAASALAIRQR